MSNGIFRLTTCAGVLLVLCCACSPSPTPADNADAGGDADGDADTDTDAIIEIVVVDEEAVPVDHAHFDDRVAALIAKLTLEQKISQLGHRSPEVRDSNDQLLIPEYNYWNEALHGVARAGLATSFPQAIALASTWHPGLIEAMGAATSDEARVKHHTDNKGLTYWSPTINLARDPRWGRCEEAYSEDPFLTGRIGSAFVKGMQGDHPRYLKTVATAKHFVANNHENNRHTDSASVDERNLHEYYLRPFKKLVQHAKVYSLMSAYNAVSGTDADPAITTVPVSSNDHVPASASSLLQTTLLRDQWGFYGYVVSDCGAIYDIHANHHYTDAAPQAAAYGVLAGTDLNCSVGNNHYQNYLDEALSQGLLTEKNIDRALHRVLKARFVLGEFDDPADVPYSAIPDSELASDDHAALALRIARESMVLLKNKGKLLPLSNPVADRDGDGVAEIAVIGPNADEVVLGGYSGTPPFQISPLSGIFAKAGRDAYFKIEAESYSTQQGTQSESCDEGGLNAAYIENGDWLAFEKVAFSTGAAQLSARVASATDGGAIEVRLDQPDGPLVGTCTVSGTGGWQEWEETSCDIDGASAEGIRDLYLVFTGQSGYLFNLNWFRFVPIDPDYPPPPDGMKITYAKGCEINSDDSSNIAEAVGVAQAADVAVVVLGTNIATADEGRDREDLALPGVQEQLIREVHGVNPNTVVVLVTGFPLAIGWLEENVPAILSAWYGGQAGGTAIADVLFGDYNPGGKLTMTWYQSTDDLPDIKDYDIRPHGSQKGRTYLYFDGAPLYPFGHGLSYTTFEYQSMTIDPQTVSPGGEVLISVTVKNTGSVRGDEVVQIYTGDQQSTAVNPIKILNGFKRISLEGGQTARVIFTLPVDRLTQWDPASDQFAVEPGLFDVEAGSSSADIRLSDWLQVTEK